MTFAEVLKAANFAAERHRDQRRKDPQGTPYINHPIGVAHILANEGKQLQIRPKKDCNSLKFQFRGSRRFDCTASRSSTRYG